jgi:hypothetical protein
VAICHYFQSGHPVKNTSESVNKPVKKSKNGKYSGWEAFVQDNPRRTK